MCPDETTIALFAEAALDGARRAAIEAHVDTCPACRRVVAELTRGAFEAKVTPRAEDALETAMAQTAQLGRYVSLGLIGVGGMGAVYAAYDPALDRKIAIKLLRPRVLDGAELEARLVREARALAKIAHPNVVAVHDVGEVEGRVFLAMEHVTGGTLTDWLRREDVTWRERLAMFVQAARGLAAAHAAGIIHRDFKPDNVLIGADGRARVTDFGLARAGGELAAETPVEPAITAAGALVGTPFYMAPEQFAGAPADERSDQFSLCVALYHALYGTRPFAGDTVGELSRTVQAGELRKPARTTVPARIGDVVMRGLAVDPSARHRSVEALLDRLAAVTTQRRRWIAGGVAAITVLAGAGFALARPFTAGEVCGGGPAELAAVWGRPEREAIRNAFVATGLPYATDASSRVAVALDHYGARWTDEYAAACRATEVHHSQTAPVMDARMSCLAERKRELRAVIGVLATADRVVVEHGVDAVSRLAALDDCEDTARLVRLARPQDPAALALASAGADQLASAIALYDAGKARDAVGRLRALAAAPPAVLDVGLRARIQLALGKARMHTDATKDAEAALYAAVWAAEEARDDQTRAAAWVLLVHVVGGARPAEVDSIVQHARAVLSHLPADDDLRTAMLIDQGNAASLAGKYPEALAAFERAAEERKRKFGATSPEYEIVLTDWSQALYDSGKVDRALELAKEAVHLGEVAYGPDHPSTAIDLNNLANVMMGANQYKQALAISERTLKIFVASFGEQNASVGAVLTNLAEQSRALGQLDRASEYGERAIAVYRGLHDDFGTARILMNVALIERQRGRLDRAVELTHEAVPIMETKLADRAEFIAVGANLAAGIYLAAGKPAEALPLVRRSLETSEKLIGRDNPRLIYPIQRLGETLGALDKQAEAVGYFERALVLVPQVAAQDPEIAAHVRFELARALAPKDRARAVVLATQALADAKAANDPQVIQLATEWLAQHRR